MAGIGFALRDLMRKDGLWSLIESQLHGVIAVAGPWFFTIVAMALPSLLLDPKTGQAATAEFVTLLLYVFSLSLTLTSPIAIALTRHVSDCMYQRRENEIAISFVWALGCALVTVVPVVWAAYAWLDLPSDQIPHAVCAYALVSTNWIAAPMLSTIRQFRLLTAAFAIGTGVFYLMIAGHRHLDAAQLLVGFNVGMAATNAVVCALILHNFSGEAGPVRGLFESALKYWELALSGLLYGIGIWVDKWLMWTAPEHHTVRGGLISYPMYDTAVFVAYVTTVPALALFIVKAETSLHESCDALYRTIQNHGDYARLLAARARIIDVFVASARDVGLVQSCVTALVLLLPTLVLGAVGVQQSGVFLFRFCAMGAAFQSGVLMLTIVLHYFDSRRAVLQINLVFLLTNLVFSWASVQLGFAWYGVGYFLSCVITFALAYWLVHSAFNNMLYLAFVRQNAAVTNAQTYPPLGTTYFEAQTAPGPLEPEATT